LVNETAIKSDATVAEDKMEKMEKRDWIGALGQEESSGRITGEKATRKGVHAL
jgi:hypothetical protein